METLLIFHVGDAQFGLDSDRISRVQRIPPITPVPLTGSGLKGVTVVDGRLLPVVDLAERIGTGAVDTSSDQARLLAVQMADGPVGFLVDRVAMTVEVEPDQVQTGEADNPWVEGVCLYLQNPVQLLRPEALLDEAMLSAWQAWRLSIPLPQGDATRRDDGTGGVSAEQTDLMLRFVLGDTHFALPTDLIRELLFVPEGFTPLAGAPQPPVLGLTPLRGELVSVLDLSAHMGFDDFEPSMHSRLVVVTDRERVLALAVPCVQAVEEVPLEQIQQVRTIEQKQDAMPVAGVYRDPSGEVVSILSHASVRSLVERFALTEVRSPAQTGFGTEPQEEMMELAVFRIGDEAYAFEIEQVQEIIRYQPVTPIPEPPRFVEGILNLRGKVIPVINLPQRLGFAFSPTEQSKIVVGLHEGEQVGFLVDEVEEILYVSPEQCTFSDDPDSLIHATVTLDDGRRVILWLRVERVLEGIRFAGLK